MIPALTEGGSMSGTMDEAKGRAKEAAGALTDDDDLKREGQSDQMAGRMKEKVDEAGDWARKRLTT